MGVCLITYFNKNFSSIGKISARTIKEYAERYGFEHKIFQNVKISRPPAWTKIFLINNLLKSDKYDFIIWVDADALFVDFTKNILSEIKINKHLYLVKHKINGKEVPNTGFFIVRNSQWSKDFFNYVWRMKKYAYNNIWENAAVADLLGYKDIITINKKKEFIEMLSYKLKIRFLFTILKRMFKTKNESINTLSIDNNFNFEVRNSPYLKKVRWLNKKWNSIPEDMAKNPIIKHYPNCSNRFRLNYMKKDLQNTNFIK